MTTSAVHIFDDLHPEDGAMLQALYSRSPASVMTHIDKVRGADSGAFMARYYVGYGHASIGDCGTTTIFVENVSMLVAKAIQDHPLYNGQESSTRYLDFGAQAFIDPYGHPASQAILDGWRALYLELLPQVKDGLAKRYPFEASGEADQRTWDNAIKARAFDILRSLLPVGAATSLSWHTTLRQARDKLRLLVVHPLPEVRDVARQIFEGLLARYPHSFHADDLDSESGRAAERLTWAAAYPLRFHVSDPAEVLAKLPPGSMDRLAGGAILADSSRVDVQGLRYWESDLLQTRPRGGAIPRALDAYGAFRMAFLLDFGSFRDLQRHRNGICPIPLIDGRFGFHPWYLAELRDVLPDSAYARLVETLAQQAQRIAGLSALGLDVDPMRSQYLHPMGTRVLCQIDYTLPEMVYVGELRSGKTVHPTLRPIAQRMLKALSEAVPGLRLYGDMAADSWTVNRGEQDIRENAKNGSEK